MATTAWRSRSIEVQGYCAVIAYLQIDVWTGRRLTKRIFGKISYYFMGPASEEEQIARL
ncbi:hypothetical protein SAMN06265222_116130 [Neorhodopirellula lusitana]|uniref:Transposase n=1 Tax=Neorhodopirellula lusitana TaxID=445327 RepID=A0ABY1QKF7_9BACT|nr:hypothetical protein SAMN06265222_116130 [Neorhodopirellula lusitana]